MLPVSPCLLVCCLIRLSFCFPDVFFMFDLRTGTRSSRVVLDRSVSVSEIELPNLSLPVHPLAGGRCCCHMRVIALTLGGCRCDLQDGACRRDDTRPRRVWQSCWANWANPAPRTRDRIYRRLRWRDHSGRMGGRRGRRARLGRCQGRGALG